MSVLEVLTIDFPYSTLSIRTKSCELPPKEERVYGSHDASALSWICGAAGL